MVKQVADLKGKRRATPSTTPEASNPLRSELQSSQIARRKHRDLLEMDEMEVNSRPQPPPSEERVAATRGGDFMLTDSFMGVSEQFRGTCY